MYNLKITALASKELDEIVLYLSDHLKNPMAATHFLDEIEKCYAVLKKSPRMYERCRDERLSKLRYRKVVVKNYILIYRIDEANQTVYILHLFYGKRDYQKLI